MRKSRLTKMNLVVDAAGEKEFTFSIYFNMICTMIGDPGCDFFDPSIGY
jgi:hypothetical protein